MEGGSLAPTFQEREMSKICVRWLHHGDVTRVCWLYETPDGTSFTSGYKDCGDDFEQANFLAMAWQAHLKSDALVYADKGL